MMILKKIQQYFDTKKLEKQRQEELGIILNKVSNINLNTPKIRKINNISINTQPKMSYKEKLEKEKQEQIESKQRQEELVKIIEHLREIDLSKPRKKENKIDIISMINIEKMNNEQLKNTYKFIKKSIVDCTNKGRTEEIERLQKLKQRIKKNLLENSDELEKIKITLKTGDFENIDEYEQYLLKLYNEMNQKKIINFDESERERKIKILTLLKLIKKIKSNNKQYKRKIA